MQAGRYSRGLGMLVACLVGGAAVGGQQPTAIQKKAAYIPFTKTRTWFCWM